MNKIINWLKQPLHMYVFCATSLISGGLGGIFIAKGLQLQEDTLKRGKVCQESYDMMCVQVHACIDTPVEECDRIVSEKEVCRVNLPDLQVIYSCKEELRHIQCTDELPTSCSIFMDTE